MIKLQNSDFKYVRNDSGYDQIKDFDFKLGKFQTICGTIDCVFRNKVRQGTKV